MRSVFLLILLASSALAQAAPPSAFEVASIRSNPQLGREMVDTAPGSLTIRSTPFAVILQWAYHVQVPQISGPDWMASQRYDILAKAGHPASDTEMRSMLQALLAERFHLAIHRETKEMRVFALVQAKSGSKLTPSSTEGPIEASKDPVKGAIVRRISIDSIADDLARQLRTPVLDMTGLNGRFDFSVNVQAYLPTSREEAKNADPLAILESILQNELGLKLEARKAPVELLIVDRADRTPTEN